MVRLPRWDLHRTLPNAAGPSPPVAESADITNLMTFPMLPAAGDIDIEAGGFTSALIYWDATGTNIGGVDTDTITLEPMVWDGLNDRWTRRPRIVIGHRVIGEVQANHATRIRLRVHAVTLNAAVRDVRLFSTGGVEASRP